MWCIAGCTVTYCSHLTDGLGRVIRNLLSIWIYDQPIFWKQKKTRILAFCTMACYPCIEPKRKWKTDCTWCNRLSQQAKTAQLLAPREDNGTCALGHQRPTTCNKLHIIPIRKRNANYTVRNRPSRYHVHVWAILKISPPARDATPRWSSSNLASDRPPNVLTAVILQTVEIDGSTGECLTWGEDGSKLIKS